MAADEPRPQVVAFSVEPTVRYIEKFHRTRKCPNMTKQVFEKFDGPTLTDGMLEEAAKLFNENYGIWGKDAANPNAAPRPG